MATIGTAPTSTGRGPSTIFARLEPARTGQPELDVLNLTDRIAEVVPRNPDDPARVASRRRTSSGTRCRGGRSADAAVGAGSPSGGGSHEPKDCDARDGRRVGLCACAPIRRRRAQDRPGRGTAASAMARRRRCWSPGLRGGGAGHGGPVGVDRHRPDHRPLRRPRGRRGGRAPLAAGAVRLDVVVLRARGLERRGRVRPRRPRTPGRGHVRARRRHQPAGIRRARGLRPDHRAPRGLGGPVALVRRRRAPRGDRSRGRGGRLDLRRGAELRPGRRVGLRGRRGAGAVLRRYGDHPGVGLRHPTLALDPADPTRCSSRSSEATSCCSTAGAAGSSSRRVDGRRDRVRWSTRTRPWASR